MLSHAADVRHHGRAVEFDNQEQGFYCGLPLLEILLGLGKLLDVFGGLVQRNEMSTAGRAMRWLKARDQDI
jgi:hypothetical protein